MSAKSTLKAAIEESNPYDFKAHRSPMNYWTSWHGWLFGLKVAEIKKKVYGQNLDLNMRPKSCSGHMSYDISLSKHMIHCMLFTISLMLIGSQTVKWPSTDCFSLLIIVQHNVFPCWLSFSITWNGNHMHVKDDLLKVTEKVKKKKILSYIYFPNFPIEIR